jgi:hypothetical protein
MQYCTLIINVGGNVLEMLIINRIMHHITYNLLNQNQFGFTPKKITTDAAMAAKEFVGEGLHQWLITILVSLDVKGAIDAA